MFPPQNYQYFVHKQMDRQADSSIANEGLINVNQKFNSFGRKHCGKSRICCSPAFYPFATMFTRCFQNRVPKSQPFMVRGPEMFQELHIYTVYSKYGNNEHV